MEKFFGLIGPDGSGKTSIFRMLTNHLLHPDSGSAEIEGLDVVKDYKKKSVKFLVICQENFSLYQDLTVEENLEFFSQVFSIQAYKKIMI